MPLLDFLSDLILAVTSYSHQDGSALKHEAVVAVLLQFGGSRFHLGRKGEGR